VCIVCDAYAHSTLSQLFVFASLFLFVSLSLCLCRLSLCRSHFLHAIFLFWLALFRSVHVDWCSNSVCLAVHHFSAYSDLKLLACFCRSRATSFHADFRCAFLVGRYKYSLALSVICFCYVPQSHIQFAHTTPPDGRKSALAMACAFSLEEERVGCMNCFSGGNFVLVHSRSPSFCALYFTRLSVARRHTSALSSVSPPFRSVRSLARSHLL